MVKYKSFISGICTAVLHSIVQRYVIPSLFCRATPDSNQFHVHCELILVPGCARSGIRNPSIDAPFQDA